MKQPLYGCPSVIAARLVGVSFQKLDRWAHGGIAIPSIRASGGSGRYRLWSFTDLVGLRVMKSLLDDGLPLPRLRRILPTLRDFTKESSNLKALAQCRLVVLGDGETVAVAMDAHRLMELFPQPGQLLVASLVIDLKPALVDIQQAIEAEGLHDRIQELRGAGAWVLAEIAS